MAGRKRLDDGPRTGLPRTPICLLLPGVLPNNVVISTRSKKALNLLDVSASPRVCVCDGIGEAGRHCDFFPWEFHQAILGGKEETDGGMDRLTFAVYPLTADR